MHWNPPEHWLAIRTLDGHTGGEPLRLIESGFPEIGGATMLERRAFARAHYDHLRKALMWEPRGHADMYGAILTGPATPDGDVGVLFLHNEGFSTMCGHGIIAVATLGTEAGILPDRDPLRIDTPAGRVTASVHRDGTRVTAVSFENVPSFVLAHDIDVDVDDLGTVRCDLAFGGAFYAYVDAAAVGLELTPDRAGEVIDLGRRIKRAVEASVEIAHPTGDADLGFLYGTIFVGPPQGDAHSRNACVFADGELDRSPTGTGVSGRAAIHHERGELAAESIRIESILGTTFDVRVAGTTAVGDRPAIVPEVTGRAHFTGRHEFWIDPDDPLRGGFLLR